MIIEPTVAECVFWWVLAGIGLLVLVAVNLPWNDRYDPKGDDPYKDCPKDEEW